MPAPQASLVLYLELLPEAALAWENLMAHVSLRMRMKINAGTRQISSTDLFSESEPQPARFRHSAGVSFLAWAGRGSPAPCCLLLFLPVRLDNPCVWRGEGGMERCNKESAPEDWTLASHCDPCSATLNPHRPWREWLAASLLSWLTVTPFDLCSSRCLSVDIDSRVPARRLDA